MTAYLLERAWVDGAVHDTVRVEVEGGRFTSVEVDTDRPGIPVRGLTLPGFANAHSHAFHRALRGRTQRERGSFWTWRQQMYAAAERLEPDTYFALARAAYREMVASGYTSVAEFHYVHHRPDGAPYENGEMESALQHAAEEAGIRMWLMDACYLSSGFGKAPEGIQVRFSDGDAATWASRAGSGPAAIHSVRAVPRDQLHVFRGWAPLHVHLSEQRAENEACLDAYGLTPTGLLHAEGLLGPGTTVVHATHLTDEDIEILGSSGTHVCITPTTERDLADGIGPARRLSDAGCPISIGSDSQAVIDPFEEMRGLEMDERLATESRGHWTAGELLDVGTNHAAIGIEDAGRIEAGALADLVTIDTASPRTAGTGSDEQTAVFAATADDVRQVMVSGTVVYTRDDDETIGRELDAAIGRLWQ